MVPDCTLLDSCKCRLLDEVNCGLRALHFNYFDLLPNCFSNLQPFSREPNPPDMPKSTKDEDLESLLEKPSPEHTKGQRWTPTGSDDTDSICSFNSGGDSQQTLQDLHTRARKGWISWPVVGVLLISHLLIAAGGAWLGRQWMDKDDLCGKWTSRYCKF